MVSVCRRQRLVDLAGGALAAAGVKLGHQEGFFAVSVAQGFAHADFAGAVVVVPAVVEEVDAFIERGADDADAFLLVLLAAEVVSAQADAGDVLSGVAQGAVGNAVFYFGGPDARQQRAGHGDAGGSLQELAAGERGLGVGHGRSPRGHYPTGKGGSATTHVGADVLICPAERSSAIFRVREAVELRSTGQMRTSAPTWLVVD